MVKLAMDHGGAYHFYGAETLADGRVKMEVGRYICLITPLSDMYFFFEAWYMGEERAWSSIRRMMSFSVWEHSVRA